MPLRNRVDPFGDLHAVAARGMFTGNRGCLVDDDGAFVRHHRGTLWITCRTRFRGRRVGLTRPRRWTPVFFLDDAVALAAGHRPCGECRWEAYHRYRGAVDAFLSAEAPLGTVDAFLYAEAPARPVATGRPVRAGDLNRLLAAERLRRGRGLVRVADRVLWTARSDTLPDGAVVLTDRPRLVLGSRLLAFTFDGWRDPVPRPGGSALTVLTPPTSVAALRHGFVPDLHPSALGT